MKEYNTSLTVNWPRKENSNIWQRLASLAVANWWLVVKKSLHFSATVPVPVPPLLLSLPLPFTSSTPPSCHLLLLAISSSVPPSFCLPLCLFSALCPSHRGFLWWPNYGIQQANWSCLKQGLLGRLAAAAKEAAWTRQSNPRVCTLAHKHRRTRLILKRSLSVSTSCILKLKYMPLRVRFARPLF